MKCGGFRITYRGDERIFDTSMPIIGLVVLLVLLAFVPGFPGRTGSTC